MVTRLAATACPTVGEEGAGGGTVVGVIDTGIDSTHPDLDDAYDAALQALESWRLTTPAERQMLLLRLADALEANADRLVEAQRRNTGQLAEMIRAEGGMTGAPHLRVQVPPQAGHSE